MNFIPGQGLKKPLNMLEAPIYPDIKQALPEFKWSRKYWTVDVGATLMSLESNTQLIEDAVLAKSYRENIDKYGQSSHQEKITVFRPPLQNYYEDYGPLNRLPVKIHAIEARINPGTASDSGGTVAYQVNNSQQQEVSRFITDRINKETWRNTYYLPFEHAPDNAILPDLEMKLPSTSLYSGYSSGITINAPTPDYELEDINPRLSMHSGVECGYKEKLTQQAKNIENFELINPSVSVSAGYRSTFTVDGDTRLDDMELDKTLPNRSVSSGVNSQYTIDGETRVDYELERNLPITPISSGYSPITTFDGITRFDDIQLQSFLQPLFGVRNPGSEDGYKTDVNDENFNFVAIGDHMKQRENPKVPIAAHKTFDYIAAENMHSEKVFFRNKIEPVKSYSAPLNRGTIKTSGLDVPTVGGHFLRGQKVKGKPKGF